MTLNEFFSLVPKAAVAFSGGADSAFLLWAAKKCGCDVRAYYVKTAFQPQFELEDARRLAAELAVPMTVVEADILAVPEVAANGPERCYFCKRALFAPLREAARATDTPLLLDGTNASDDAGDRPGMRALRELEVRSPLRECGMTKDEVRRALQGGGAVHLGQARLRLPGHPHPHRHPHYRGGPERVEAAEGALFSPGLPGLPGAAVPRRGPAPADGGAAARWLWNMRRHSPPPLGRFDGVLLDLKPRHGARPKLTRRFSMDNKHDILALLRGWPPASHPGGRPAEAKRGPL